MSLSILLRLTLSGSALAVLLLAMRYVFFKRMPSTAYYYAWLLVLLRFVLPLPGLLPDLSGKSAAPVTAISAPAPWDGAQLLPAGDYQPMTYDELAARVPIQDAAQTGASAKHGPDLKSPALWLTVWAVGAGLCLSFYVLSYALFTARVRRSLSPATEEDHRVYAKLGESRPKLCRCAAYAAPLMFGVIHPIITLPERDYDEALLTNILRHELAHYRRRDPLYKWFSVAVLSTQWFNPLAWVIRRELNRACELSCDERLLRDMDRAGKLSYGNTLLNMAESAALPAGVIATTFSTEKRNLKERLEQIMSYKHNRARILAGVLTLVLLLGCGILAGPAAVAAPSNGAGSTVKVSTVDELLAAIAPDTVIELAAGTYDLSAASNYGQDTHSSYYSWNGAYDGFELYLHNVQNLTLRGAGKGETVISAVPRYANVLRFTGCKNVTVENLTAGHTEEPGVCSGGVLSFQNCNQVMIEKMRLYGCGILGIQASQCSSFNILRTEIYECSQGAGVFFQTDGISFTDCDVHDVPSPAFYFIECGDKTWNGEPFSGLTGIYDVDASGNLIAAEDPYETASENQATVFAPDEAAITPEEAEQAALREIEVWKQLGLLNAEVEFEGDANAVVEIPGSIGSENWYGRIFPQHYDVRWYVGPGVREDTEQHKYGCNISIDALSGKIISAYIDAMADADDEPVREAVHWEPLDPRNPEGESQEWTLYFYDNFEDIFPADMTVDRFCALLAEYWGFSGYRLAETVDDMYFDEPQPSVESDSLLKNMNADTRDNYYLTVFFEGDQPGAPRYIQLHQFPGYVTLSLGIGGHAVG